LQYLKTKNIAMAMNNDASKLQHSKNAAVQIKNKITVD
tara:strand:- start:1110 stop:1223 length:114 start_codon:yes stop_codon:yes gene_type:complete